LKNKGIDSILVINNFLSVCKLKKPNCLLARLTQSYLKVKVNRLLQSYQTESVLPKRRVRFSLFGIVF